MSEITIKDRVLKNFDFNPNEADFWEEAPISRYLKENKNPEEMRKTLKRIIKVIKEKANPRAVLTIKKRDEATKNLLSLPQEMEDLESLVLVISTIGDTIELEDPSFYEEFLLDGAKNVYLRLLNRRICQMINEEMKENGFNTTCPIFPGSGRNDWDMENQKSIFEILGADKIDVSLTKGNMLDPEKSCSFAMGVDKNIKQGELTVSCKNCEREDCLYRRTERPTSRIHG